MVAANTNMTWSAIVAPGHMLRERTHGKQTIQLSVHEIPMRLGYVPPTKAIHMMTALFAFLGTDQLNCVALNREEPFGFERLGVRIRDRVVVN